MSEFVTEHEISPLIQTDSWEIKTLHSPHMRDNLTVQTPSAASKEAIDFQKRYIEHLKLLSGRNSEKAKLAEEERRKSEKNKEKLTKLVLDSCKKRVKIVDEERIEDYSPKSPEPTLPTVQKLDANFKGRHEQYLVALQTNIKQRKNEEMKNAKRKLLEAKKLKDELGFSKVTAKVCKPFNTNFSTPVDLEIRTPTLKQSPKLILPFKEKDKEVRGREAGEKILKRARDYIQQLSEKKKQDLGKLDDKRASVCRYSSEKEEDDIDCTPSPVRRKHDLEAQARLESFKKYHSVPAITDMKQFKKRNKLGDKDKVFVLIGGYTDVREALISRNWFENTDRESPCFDLIWSTKYKYINFGELESNQLCNHFEQTGKITTKAGLCKSLKHLIWFQTANIDTFFPKCFTMYTPEDREEFVVEFKKIHAESILKKYINGGIVHTYKVVTAIEVIERSLRDVDEIIDLQGDDYWKIVHDYEWEILNTDDTNITENIHPKIQALASDITHLLAKTQVLCKRLKDRNPQYELNGYNNIWICKPGNLSRGRGISCFNTLEGILEYTSIKQENRKWVVQKYIENPMCIQRKKFDMRQWVLVTDWNPLTIWFYERCYLRFGVDDFDMSNLKNKYIHLTNNSITKHSSNYSSTQIEGSMWFSEHFGKYLQEQYGQDIWTTKIKPQIKNIVKLSLESVQDTMDNRKNSFELYGYDIMIDEDCNPWLIEVNASPAMDYSTEVTEELVQEVLEDTVKVVVDYNFASAKKKGKVDTGNYSLLYKAKQHVERPINAITSNLVVQGKAIKR